MKLGYSGKAAATALKQCRGLRRRVDLQQREGEVIERVCVGGVEGDGATQCSGRVGRAIQGVQHRSTQREVIARRGRMPVQHYQ